MGIRQHYVPKFYLRNFSDSEQKCIGVFRFENQQFIRKAAIKSVAYRNNLYDDDDTIEKELAIKEKRWKEAVDIFIGRNVTEQTLIDLEEHAEETTSYLLEFILASEVRTTQHGDSLSFFIQTLEEKFGRDMSKETYEEYFGNIQEFCKHPNLISLQIAFEHIRYFSGLELLVIVNGTKQKFITSDVPVLNLNPLYTKRKCYISFGLKSMGLQKFITISGNCCLCLYDRNAYTKNCKDVIYTLNSKKTVHRINQIIVENAYEQIFFGGSENERYIRKICSNRKLADVKSRVAIFGKNRPELVEFHKDNIWTPLYLPCFSIKKEALKLPFPTHMGGLTRPEIENIDNCLE